jgi:tetratricopeptide (TPR) repeat protein
MRLVVFFAAIVVCALLVMRAAGPEGADERLARHRNLGKAFYENPTTQNEAVEEFRKALALAPNSARERLNYGLALLRAGKTAEGIAELIKVQKQDPSIPHTWFNLGIAYKKAGEQNKAIHEFEQMVKLVPDEPISRYNLGALYRLAGKTDDAVREFRTAAKLDPTLAAPHFQLFNLLRTSGRQDEAKPELEIFQRLKKQQEGAAIPEDVEWSMYAEVYDVMADAPKQDKVAELKFETRSGPAAPAANPREIQVDYDHDYDLDRVVLGTKPVMMRNQGPAGYQRAEFPFVEGEALSGTTFRVVPDTKGFDLVITYAGRDAALYRDKLQGRYEAESIAIPPGATNLAAADLNNDGWIDVVYTAADGTHIAWNKSGRFESSPVLSSNRSSFTLVDLENRGALDIVFGREVLRNNGAGAFTARQTDLPAECPSWSVGDFDHDGRADLACGSKQFLNRTQTANAWIGVTIAGVKNIKNAAGSEIEVKAGSRYQKKLYQGAPLVFGLGSEKQADTVRITWPNGLIQNEIKQAGGKHYKYEEAQRLSGSCPIIWSWNGREFEYITDVLGVAPLGASAGDGRYFPVDHDEYIQIPAKSLVAVDGEYRIRITEELSEVAYIDQLKLIAVDHPDSIAIYTNDKFKGPPFPEFRLYGVRKRIPPKSAKTSDGRNVLERVLAKDERYADDFSRNLAGVAALHHIDLDFGSASKQSILVLSGWVDWADGSTFLGVAQQGKGGLIPPSLQVKDKQGAWQTVIEDMGMPAGKPKTITVDLTHKWLSDSREVRISTNLCVYWDEVFLSEDNAQPDVRLQTAFVESADLRFRGFSPAIIHPERKQPERFTYSDAKPVSMWNPTPGLYTRYGGVRELAATVDDKMIVMGSGDEIQLRFKALPAPPSGWTRDFLLLVDGWAKDRDANTAHGQSTGPLPFHSMSRFPYPSNERFPDDQAHRAYLRDYNTRPALRLIRPLR